MSLPRKESLLLISMLMAANCAVAEPVCAPPPGFQDTPHPQLLPLSQMVSRSETILVNRPLSVVAKAMDKPLNETILKSGSLPGVTGDYMLTQGGFGAPGSRHLVCLTDGTSVLEQSLDRSETSTTRHFRYIVWNYSTRRGRAIAYGVGNFETVEIDAGLTRIVWTYSFRLRNDFFPGRLGALGRWIFRVRFLDRDYAALMRGVLEGYKRDAESSPPVQ